MDCFATKITPDIDIPIFCTERTLNERFVRKQRWNYFIRNGYTSSPNSSLFLKKRVVFSERKRRVLDNRFKSFFYIDKDLNLTKTKNEKHSLSLLKLATSRRTVLSRKLANWAAVHVPESSHFRGTLNHPTKVFSWNPSMWSSRAENFGRFGHFGRNRSSKRNLSQYFSNTRISKFVWTGKKTSFKYDRQKLTKEQLDDELDRYMSEVKVKRDSRSDNEKVISVDDTLNEVDEIVDKINIDYSESMQETQE